MIVWLGILTQMAETTLPITVTGDPTGIQTVTINPTGQELLTPQVIAALETPLTGRRITSVSVVNNFGGSMTLNGADFDQAGYYPLSAIEAVRLVAEQSGFREAGIPLRRATVITTPIPK